jgi:hypothetical protein
MAVTCTWEPDACTAAAGTATLARIDPPALSARMAEIMMFRPMRMTSSMAFTEVSSPLHGSGGTHGTSEQCGLLPICGNCHTPRVIR